MSGKFGFRSSCCAGVLLASIAIARGEDAKLAELPLGKVVLFNSGVGFFEHRGKVQDNAKVELKFHVEEVNDLLKSMVLEDRGGGKISTVTYGSRDPITMTLKTFSIDLTDEPTLADLLRQVRGERIRVSAPNPIEGKIIGVEAREQKVGDDKTVEVNLLTLLTETGLRSIPMDSISETRLLDEKLNAELNEALGVLAFGHTADKKTVTLAFNGQGERPVRVGYIQETPVWKTSYRLVLKDNERPFLQGWAIVENTTEHDWNNVNLTLVSGRPISFMMDLYQPLYAERPLVQPEMFASLRPQKYGQDLSEPTSAAATESGGRLGMGGMGGGMGGMGGGFGGFGGSGGGGAGGGGGVAGPGPGILQPPATPVPTADMTIPFDPQSGIVSAASAEEVGELFRYAIADPVTLPRQKSAMLPIVNESIEGEKVAIYNPAVQAKHPLNGVQLKNTTNLHLMQGPITLFDGGEYAGDAQIEDLAPGAKRLVSYALDLDTEVATEGKPIPEEMISVKIVKGTIVSRHLHRLSVAYTIKNSGNKTKKLLIESPINAGWTLRTPKEPTEKTRSLYRFAVEAKPNAPVTFNVEEERIDEHTVALANGDDETIVTIIKAKATSPAVKRSIEEMVKRRQEWAAIAQRQQQVGKDIQEISDEQSRIRSNMVQLDRTGELYKRYVKKFGEQEDQIEKLREVAKKLAAELATANSELTKFINNLEVE